MSNRVLKNTVDQFPAEPDFSELHACVVFVNSGVKGVVQHFGKYFYLLSGKDLDEKTYTTLISV